MKSLTYAEAEVLWKKTQYACDAVGSEINPGDAAAFFLEGYEHARGLKELSDIVKCPFCGEDGFPLVGLKSHLLEENCWQFNRLDSIEEGKE
jgi:hypothetical protein